MNKDAATEFAACVAAGYSIYSTLNSSPWTAESFGGDPEKAKSCLYYSRLATITNLVLGVFTSIVARSPWPLAGFGVVSVEMHYLYHRAVGRAQHMGSTTWSPSVKEAAASAPAAAGAAGRPR